MKYYKESKRKKYPTNNKKLEGKLDWSHLAQELSLKHVTEEKIKKRV